MKLGDVSGLTDLVSTTDLLPSDYSVMEVDQYGNQTLGSITSGPGGDPFALAPGALDPGYEGVDPASAASTNPAHSTYLPLSGSYDDSSAVAGFDEEQAANAATIVKVGHSVGASDRDIQTALMAAIVESGLRNLDHGDRDSLGLFQQRDAWGSAEDRTDPATAAKMFFLGGQGGQQGLLDIKDRDSKSLGDLAQDVQVSAFPDRYAEHESEAASLMSGLSSTSTSVYKGDDTSYVGPYRPKELWSRARDLANSSDSDYYRLCQRLAANLSGKDHSGYATAADAQRTFQSNGQFHSAGDQDGDEPPVGAWLYYNTGSSAGHVATYLGDGMVLSNDVITNGKASIVPMSDMTDGRWHLDYQGWASPWGEGTVQQVPGKTQKPRLDRLRGTVVRNAKQLVGTPFSWDDDSDQYGVGISGFLRHTYGALGLDVPRFNAKSILQNSPSIDVKDANPGDIIVWSLDHEGGLGIYTGNNQMIEVGGPGRPVQISSLGTDAMVYGKSMLDVLNRSTKTEPLDGGTPTVTSNPGTVTTTEVSPGTSVVEPHAHITAAKPKHSGSVDQGTTWDQKPHV